IDNSGFDFLVIRNGGLYFEYATRWSDVANGKGQITVENFEEMLSASLRQVLHFYEQHWQEPIAGIIFSAPAFKEEDERAIETTSNVPMIMLKLKDNETFSPEWFVAYGTAIRSWAARDGHINLLGGAAQKALFEEQTLSFMDLWRVAIPLAIIVLIITYSLA